MTSYLRKYVTALASAKDYVAQWSSDHVFADEELIVPFPTLAIFEPDKHVWSIYINAWIYLPFQSKTITDYLPSLPSFLTGSGNDKKETNEESIKSNDEDKNKKTILNEDEHNQTKESTNVTVDKDKKDAAATASKDDHKAKKKDEASDSDDDMYDDALRKYFSSCFYTI
jgi:hypothetical protein